MQAPLAAESKGQQNEYHRGKKNILLSPRNSTTDCDFEVLNLC